MIKKLIMIGLLTVMICCNTAQAIEIIRTVPIIYPLAARYQGEEGTVKILTDTNGNAEILESSGYKRLDNAALYAISKWEFKDVEENTDIIIPVIFKLVD